MNKRQFRKKHILGLIKTYHAKRRQVERDITDQLLIKILSDGELQDRGDNGQVVVYDGYQVYLSNDLDIILTVVAPQIAPTKPKTISLEDGEKIKEKIPNKNTSCANDCDDEDSNDTLSFEEYIKKGLY